AEDLDALGVRGQAAVGDPEDVGDGAADRDRGLVVGVAPGEAGGGQLDEPLGRHLGAGVGGVEVDGPLGTGVAVGGRRLRDLEVAHQVQELVQGVGGQVQGDGVGGADRA